MLAVVAAGQQARSEGKTPSTSSAPTSAARVVPVRLWERRSRRLRPGDIPAGQTFLELHVLGEAAYEAKRYGRIVIREAVDDKGVSMTSERQPTQIGMWDHGFDDIHGARPVENGFSMDVWLESGARDAAKIARVKGSFVMLVGGKVVEVVVRDLPSLVGRYVKDPVLSAAGVKLKILAVPGTVIDGERERESPTSSRPTRRCSWTKSWWMSRAGRCGVLAATLAPRSVRRSIRSNQRAGGPRNSG